MPGKPKKAPAPNYGYLAPGWQGPDTRPMAATREMLSLAQGDPSVFTTGNFGYPRPLAPPPDSPASSMVDLFQPEGAWEWEYSSGGRPVQHRNFTNAVSAAEGIPGVSAPVAGGALRQLIQHPIPASALTPIDVRLQQAQRKRRNDINTLNEITSAQSRPPTLLELLVQAARGR